MLGGDDGDEFLVGVSEGKELDGLGYDDLGR